MITLENSHWIFLIKIFTENVDRSPWKYILARARLFIFILVVDSCGDQNLTKIEKKMIASYIKHKSRTVRNHKPKIVMFLKAKFLKNIVFCDSREMVTGNWRRQLREMVAGNSHQQPCGFCHEQS